MKTRFIARCRQFFATIIGEKSTAKFPGSYIMHGLRIGYLAIRGFHAHHGPLRASALTFYTLLSLVPVMAMAFGVAQGFGLERMLEKELLNYFSSHQEIIVQIIDFARNMLENTKGGLIAGVGILVLFWSVIKVLNNIETSFNHIWGAAPRPWARKLSDYLAITIIAPLFLITAGSATVYAVSQVMALSTQVGLENFASPLLSLGLALAPYLILWILFALLYLIMPNTKVRFTSALPAAILAGSLYQLMQMAYVKFQISMTSYNAIYGSFAALPLFLIWLHLSWYIVLFGAEISQATQNMTPMIALGHQKSMSSRQIKLLALQLTARAVYFFQQGQQPRTPAQLGQPLGLDPVLAQELAELLIQGKILSRLESKVDNQHRVQPGQDIANLDLAQIIFALENINNNAQLSSIPNYNYWDTALKNLELGLRSSSANLPLMHMENMEHKTKSSRT